MHGTVTERSQLNTRVSGTAYAIMRALQEYYGLSQSGVMETILREKAKELGLNMRSLTHEFQR